MGIRLGYQQPNYQYGTGTRNIFPTLVAQAREAEASGFDCLFLMDHLCQVPAFGPPEEPVLESYTTLSALAAVTESIQLSALVTCNGFRNPALLAKMITTIDVLSDGRAVLAIGAGWMELEHRMYGYPYGTLAERFERLREALEIIVPMLRGEHPSFTGAWARADGPVNEPRGRDDLPVVVGGSGEKKTYGLAATFADQVNIECDVSLLPRKLEAIAARCSEVGRVRASLWTTFALDVIIDEDGAKAEEMLQEVFRQRGQDLDAMEKDERELATRTFFVGTPAAVAEQVKCQVLLEGIDGIIVKLPGYGHMPGALALVGATLRPLVDSISQGCR
jgi:F420-dependent oxidoreductase-like protein